MFPTYLLIVFSNFKCSPLKDFDAKMLLNNWDAWRQFLFAYTFGFMRKQWLFPNTRSSAGLRARALLLTSSPVAERCSNSQAFGVRGAAERSCFGHIWSLHRWWLGELTRPALPARLTAHLLRCWEFLDETSRTTHSVSSAVFFTLSLIKNRFQLEFMPVVLWISQWLSRSLPMVFKNAPLYLFTNF